MRFDFKLVGLEKLTEHIKKIYDLEKVEYEIDAVKMIAMAGNGSVRDALSVADRCMSMAEKISVDNVSEILAVTSSLVSFRLIEAMTAGNDGLGLKIVEEISKSGKSLERIANDVISCAINILVAQTDAIDTIIDSKENIALIQEKAKEYTQEQMALIIENFSSIESELRYSVSAKVVLQTAVVRTTRIINYDTASAMAKISQLEKRIAEIEKVKGAYQPTAIEIKAVSDQKPQDAYAVWGRLITYFRQNERMGFAMTMAEQDDVEIKANNLIVNVKDDESYYFLSTEEFKQATVRGIGINGEKIESVKIERSKKGLDMEKEIDKIKKLIGKGKISIQK